jgi:hypothetical protein
VIIAMVVSYWITMKLAGLRSHTADAATGSAPGADHGADAAPAPTAETS